MAVSDWMKPGVSQKERVKIITVDPLTRRLEVLLKDGAVVQVAIYEVPSAFVWPIPEQWWTIYRESGNWVLGDRMEVDEEENKRIEDMALGEGKFGADTIYIPSGQTIVTTNTLQTARIVTGAIDGNDSAEILVIWPLGFIDTDYTATVSVIEETVDTGTLSISKIVAQTADDILVRVDNNDSSARTGLIHAIAVAD